MISLSKMNKTYRLIPRMHKASTMKKAASEKNNEEPSPGFIAKDPKVQSPEKPQGTEDPCCQKNDHDEQEVILSEHCYHLFPLYHNCPLLTLDNTNSYTIIIYG